ncbi:MAG: phosphatase PAP2 family protein [Anaerolineales bacterium]|nr:phosphatase PAP2 family protein [Anaerolineales bacterium]
MNFRSVLEIDARTSNRLRVAEQPGLLRNISVFFAHSGDSWFWGLGLILLWVFANEPFWKKWAVVLFGGISVLAVIVMSLKFIIRRRRPEGEWGGIYRNTDPHSFPSGHAARAFMIALVATALGPAWAGILLWVWAPLVALARVAMGVHYVSDVVAGAIVGILVALLGLQIYPPVLDWVNSWFWIPLL